MDLTSRLRIDNRFRSRFANNRRLAAFLGIGKRRRKEQEVFVIVTLISRHRNPKFLNNRKLEFTGQSERGVPYRVLHSAIKIGVGNYLEIVFIQ